MQILKQIQEIKTAEDKINEPEDSRKNNVE